MAVLSNLQQNRRIVEDFTLTTLAGITTLFGRLAYIASLRDLSSGRYEHAGLDAIYPGEAVQQALQLCHEQILERLLETPLENQLEDLRSCLEGMQGGMKAAVPHWLKMEAYRVLLPEGSAAYLKELFCSNAGVLLELLQRELNQSPASG